MSGFDLKSASGAVNYSKVGASVNPIPGNRPRNIREILSTRFDDLFLVSGRGQEEIYTARDPYYHDAAVKLKVLQATAERMELELFRLEALAAAKLSHRNIIKSGPPQDLYGIHFATVENRVDVENLNSILDRQGWLDPEVVIGITRQLADALEYAHQQGVLHLCLHPESILIAEDGTVILADFGLEAAVGLGWAHNRRSHHCPVHYISPEQAANSQLDNRSDLYSLGVVVYQMLTDRLPLDAEDLQTIRKRHLTQTPLPPHFYSQDVSAELSSIVMCLLEKDPRARYEDARALREALDRFGNQNRVIVTPVEDKHLDEKPIERTTNQVALTAVPETIDQKPIEEEKPRVASGPLHQKPIDGRRIENNLQETLRIDEIDGSPLSTEDSHTEPALEAWESPDISVIDPPSHEGLHQHVEQAPINQVTYDRVLDFEKLHPSAQFLSTKFGRDTSIQQWRPVVLVAILAIASMGALILLGRINSSPRAPASVPASVNTDDQSNRPVDPAAPPKDEATRPSSENSTSANQAAVANPPAKESAKPAGAEKVQKTVVKNQPAQRSRQGKRKWTKSTMYFRQSHYGDRR